MSQDKFVEGVTLLLSDIFLLLDPADEKFKMAEKIQATFHRNSYLTRQELLALSDLYSSSLEAKQIVGARLW